MLEQQMQELRDLPARVAGVELQIVQLREEMREAFSAIRSDFHEEIGGLHGKVDGLRTEMHGIRDELRDAIHTGNQESQDFMRAMYERIQTDIRTMGEGTKGRRR